MRRKIAREKAEKELQDFVKLLYSAKSMPLHDKPAKDSWMSEEKIWSRIVSLEAYAIELCYNVEHKKTAEMVLQLKPPYLYTLDIIIYTSF